MGTQNLAEIVHQLLKHHRSTSTPIAIIKDAGTSRQEIWDGELINILRKTAGLSLSPAVIVVGEVVSLSKYL
jgi:siroheme synthase